MTYVTRILVAIYLLAVVESFSVAKKPLTIIHVETSTTLRIFGDAFKNDPALGKPQNAGLTNVSNYML